MQLLDELALVVGLEEPRVEPELAGVAVDRLLELQERHAAVVRRVAAADLVEVDAVHDVDAVVGGGHVASTLPWRRAWRVRGRFAESRPPVLAGGASRADTRSMNTGRHWRGPLLLLGLVVLVIASTAHGGPGGRLPAPASGQPGARYASAQELPARSELRFDASIARSDQQIVRQVVAEARPDARRLIDLVAGLVTISVSRPGPGIAGQTRSTAGGYDVLLDLGGVYRANGMRGLRRLVLHELAHVVDAALVPSALEARLDAATPPGIGCDGGLSGGCAARAERFAESFAKWATGDIGNDVRLGYRVPPPRSLARWGDPLGAIRR